MDKDVWAAIRWAIVTADRSIPRLGRRPLFSDALIARMYFWTVAHDRPLCWACRRCSYGRLMRPRALPSVSQFCKRLHHVRVQEIIRHVQTLMSGRDEPMDLGFIDGKALPVSESSGDPDARSGRGNGTFSRGYKLHALGDRHGRIRAFRVTALNAGEPTVARQHLTRHITAGALVLADGNYDGRWLYDAVQRRNACLLTPQKKNRSTDAAMKRTCPARRAAMKLWRDRPDLAHLIYAARGTIERTFSALTCCAGGLGPLPSWVRRLPRVTRWVTAKIALYNARVTLRLGPS